VPKVAKVNVSLCSNQNRSQYDSLPNFRHFQTKDMNYDRGIIEQERYL
jgi:hypothetical protein